MKRILIILITGLLLILTACGGNDGDKNTTADNKKENENTTEENNDNNKEESDGEIPVYQIGETAVIKNDKFDLEYEVTVNSFEITKEVDGVPLEELLTSPTEKSSFLVVDVTYKNNSGESFVPNERFLAYFAHSDGGGGDLPDYDDLFFPDIDKELAPSEEITGKLVFITMDPVFDYYTLTYEPVSDNETWFHLPNPNK